ncbi:MAG: GNAT family N-acetyltransferase [Nitrospira sp.]
MKVPDLTIRPAVNADLPDILRLYAQPALDDGCVISIAEAEQIFERMARYPDYAVYVAVVENRIVGTFGLLIMDNLGHLGAPASWKMWRSNPTFRGRVSEKP